MPPTGLTLFKHKHQNSLKNFASMYYEAILTIVKLKIRNKIRKKEGLFWCESQSAVLFQKFKFTGAITCLQLSRFCFARKMPILYIKLSEAWTPAERQRCVRTVWWSPPSSPDPRPCCSRSSCPTRSLSSQFCCSKASCVARSVCTEELLARSAASCRGTSTAHHR